MPPRLRPRRPASVLALALVAAVLALTHLGAASAATVGVTVADNTFTPGSVTVTAGDTVVWTDSGARPHTVTADDGSFDSGTLSTGATFSRTFDTPGTIPYFCKIHGAAGGIGMSGTIVVLAAQVTTTTAATTTSSTPATTTTAAPPTTSAGSPAGTAANGTTTTTTRPTAVLSATEERPPAAAQPARLARTGTPTGAVAAIGLALVLSGAVVRRVLRRGAGTGGPLRR